MSYGNYEHASSRTRSEAKTTSMNLLKKCDLFSEVDLQCFTTINQTSSPSAKVRPDRRAGLTVCSLFGAKISWPSTSGRHGAHTSFRRRRARCWGLGKRYEINIRRKWAPFGRINHDQSIVWSWKKVVVVARRLTRSFICLLQRFITCWESLRPLTLFFCKPFRTTS